jgi:hypothetical protein
MEEKLRQNDYKGGWEGVEFARLLDLLLGEVLELDEAIESGEPERIVDEAIDVANFACMIHDNARVLAGGRRAEGLDFTAAEDFPGSLRAEVAFGGAAGNLP